MKQPKYLIFRAGFETGLGHTLMSIVSYAHLCQQQQRILALDLRDFKYLRNPQVAFSEHFAFEDSDWPTIEMDTGVIDQLYASSDRLDYIYEEDLIQSISSKNHGSITDSKVIVIPSRFFSWDSSWGMKSIRLGLRGKFADKLERISAQYFSKMPVIGIHFRHGNGEHLDGRFNLDSPDYEDRYRKILDAYVARVQQIENSYKSEFPVFVCSDNREFREGLKRRLPRAFSVTSHIPDIPHLQCNADNSQAACQDAVIDLWCLSECDFLISAGSAFSSFAFQNSKKLKWNNIFSVTPAHITNSVVECPESDLIRNMLEVRLYLRNAPVSFYAYARILEIAGDMKKAATTRQRAEQLKYFENDAWRKSLWLLACAKTKSAISLISRAANNDSNPFLWMHLADLLFIEGRNSEALDTVQRAIDLDPEWPWFHSVQSKILSIMGLHNQAVATARIAASFAPDSLLLEARLSVLRLRAGRKNESEIEQLHAMVDSGCLGLSFTKEPGFPSFI